MRFKKWVFRNPDEAYEEFIQRAGEFGKLGYASGFVVAASAFSLMLGIDTVGFWSFIMVGLLLHFLDGYLAHAPKDFLVRFWRSLLPFERIGLGVAIGLWTLFVYVMLFHVHSGSAASAKGRIAEFVIWTPLSWLLIADAYAWWRRKVLAEAAVEEPARNITEETPTESNPA